MKVLHYKTNYLNNSETFINRLVKNHREFIPYALCYRAKYFTESIPVFEPPKKGIFGFLNFCAFHLNLPLPFFYRSIKKLLPDVIHAHFGYDAMKMLRLANYLNIPLIVSFYGSDISRLPSEIGWKRRYRKLAKDGTRFIAASELMKQQLLRLGFPERKITIVRFGVDLKVFTYRKEYVCEPNMMMVGRMVEKKGFEYAIRAISNLHRRGVKAKLNLYGNGPLLPMLKDLTVQLNIERSVHFYGYQPIELIMKAHDKNSVLLAPSVTAKDGDMEGLPNTILEAMATGTPVVASEHAAIPEVINHEETGFLVDERNEIQLTNVLEKIIKKEYDLESIRKNARRRIEKDYGIDLMVKKIEEIYSQKH